MKLPVCICLFILLPALMSSQPMPGLPADNLASDGFSGSQGQNTAQTLVKAELEQERYIRYVLFTGLGVLTLLVVLFYNRYRFKQRASAQLEAKKIEVEEALRRAEASEAFKSRFLANMSHEIRTPLHGIAGFTDLLLQTALTEKQRRWLTSIYLSTERLTELVNDILDISKIEAGKIRLRQTPFSPARIAADVQDSLSIKARNKGIALTVVIGNNVPEAVVGDATRLYQILINLVGNAVKFTDSGGVQLSIEGTPPIDEGHVGLTFSVADTGMGIPPEKLSSVFDSFQQANDEIAARFGGTGLGLTIARDLVHLLGSDIQVDSKQGKGTTFSFAIVFPLADLADLAAHTSHDEALYYSQPLRLLLVDENDLNREIASEALYRHFENIEITEALDGSESIEQLESHHFDIVLMDVQMPGMSGPDATQYIRSQFTDGRQHIPIIALTASNTPEEIEKALESGMNRHLGKPFKPAQLAKVIAETLQLKATSTPPDAVPRASPALQSTTKPALPDKFDLQFLRDFCKGDDEQVRHFISKFLAQYPLDLQQLQDAFEKQDREAVYQAAHNFKPQLSFVGLQEAALLTASIEQGARNGLSFIALNELLARLKDCFL